MFKSMSLDPGHATFVYCLGPGDVCLNPGDVCLGPGDNCLGHGDVCLGSGGVCLGPGDVCLDPGDVRLGIFVVTSKNTGIFKNIQSMQEIHLRGLYSL